MELAVPDPNREAAALKRLPFWTKDEVSKPQNWYSQEHPGFCSPNASFSNIHGPEKCILETEANNIANCLFSSDDSDEAEDGANTSRTVLNPLTEEEAEEIARLKAEQLEVLILERKNELMESEEREKYLNRMQHWLEQQEKTLAHETEECHSSLEKQAEMQNMIDDSAKRYAQQQMDKLLAIHNIKKREFQTACQNWRTELQYKQEQLRQKLKECRHLQPWAVTEYGMKVRMDQIATETAADKDRQIRALIDLRTKCHAARKKWAAESVNRLKLLDLALQKEGTAHVIKHVQAKLGKIEKQKVKLYQLSREVEMWEGIKERWSVLLEERITKRHTFRHGLRQLDPPGFDLSDFEKPPKEALPQALISQGNEVAQSLNILENELNRHLELYQIKFEEPPEETEDDFMAFYKGYDDL